MASSTSAADTAAATAEATAQAVPSSDVSATAVTPEVAEAIKASLEEIDPTGNPQLKSTTAPSTLQPQIGTDPQDAMAELMAQNMLILQAMKSMKEDAKKMDKELKSRLSSLEQGSQPESKTESNVWKPTLPKANAPEASAEGQQFPESQTSTSSTTAAKALLNFLLSEPEGLALGKSGMTVPGIVQWYSEHGYPSLKDLKVEDLPTGTTVGSQSPTVILEQPIGSMPSQPQTGHTTHSTSDFGVKLGKVKIPTWDGTEKALAQYKLDIKILEQSVATKDHSLISARLIAELQGNAKKYLLVEPEIISDPQYKTATGHWDLIEYLVTKMGISPTQTEHSKFYDYFYGLHRKPAESFLEYENKEEKAYRDIQTAIKKANPNSPLFQLPEQLRGWFFLQRSGLAAKEKTHLILQTGGSTDLTKIKALINEVFPTNLMATYDKVDNKNKGGHRNFYHSLYHSQTSETWDEDDDWEQSGQSYSHQEQTYDDDDFYSLLDEEEVDVETFIDEEGYFYGTEETLDVVHSSIAQDDDDYAQALLNFQQSRDVLKQLTVARNFYPVVVPVGFKPNGKGAQRKGKGKGAKSSGGKGKQSGRKPKGKGKGKGKGSQNIRIANRPKPKATAKGSKGQEPICFGCGKAGHFIKDCPNKDDDMDNPLKRARAHFAEMFNEWQEVDNTESSYVIMAIEPPTRFDYSPEDLVCLTCSEDTSTKVMATDCTNCDHSPLARYDALTAQKEHLALATATDEGRGCALMDCGATTGFASSNAIDSLQMDCPETLDADSLARSQIHGVMVGDGKVTRPKFKINVRPDIYHTDKVESINVVSNITDNHTPVIVGMDYLVRNRIVCDFESGRIVYRDHPDKVYTLKRSRGGLLYFPLSREQAELHSKVEDLKDSDFPLVITVTG